MTQRPTALVGAAIVVAVLTSTQVHARQTKHKNNHLTHSDQHFVGAAQSGATYERRTRRSSVRQQRTAPPRLATSSSMVPLSCAGVHVKGGVAASMAGRFAAFCRELAATGYKIKFVSGYRPGTCATASRHPCGGAIDINQHSRNVCEGGCPRSHINAMARRHGLLHGAEWKHADAGHFERLDRHSLAKIDAGSHPLLAAMPPQRDRKPAARRETQPALPKPRPEIPAPPMMVLASLGDDPMLDDSLEPALPIKPEPIEPADRRDIFRRYFESKDVVVRPHVTMAGVDQRLMRLVNDAATHFGRTAYINSGYRSPSYNRRVGGARNSQHKQGRAVDFRIAGISPWELRGWIVARMDRWNIRGIGTYRTHLHADVRSATKLVTWTGGRKKRRVMYTKHRKPGRYAAAG